MKAGWWTVLAGLTLVIACAQPKGAREWTSIPPVQTSENLAFDVRFEPLKKDKPFFVAFRLDMTNKSEGNLTIDWNRTRYLHNGRPDGAFGFHGIDPASLKDATIPPDTIAPGTTFSREVFPANLVAFAPMREEVLNNKGRGLFPGPLPAGENGIRLVVQKDGKEMVQEVVVEIR